MEQIKQLDVEEFLASYRLILLRVAEDNRRVYRIAAQEYDDLVSELTLCMIKWHGKYAAKFAHLERRHLGALLRYHLRHKAQTYVNRHILHHWVDAIHLDGQAQQEEGQPGGFELEDPKQLRAMLQTHNKWIYTVVSLLPPEDREIILYRFGLNGQEEHSLVETEHKFGLRTGPAISRLKRAAELFLSHTEAGKQFRNGKPLRTRSVRKDDLNPGPRPTRIVDWELKPRKRNTMETEILCALAQGINESWDIAKCIQSSPQVVSVKLQRMKDKGLVVFLHGKWELTEKGRDKVSGMFPSVANTSTSHIQSAFSQNTAHTS